MQSIVQQSTLFSAASDFITRCYTEMGKTQLDIDERLLQINNDIHLFGHYVHTYDELSYGAKMAWRNSNRCIGRLFWDSLTVIDARHINKVDEMAKVLFEHIEHATNDGKIRPCITVFSPVNGDDISSGPRIWNHQLIRYAGYTLEDGTIIGDSASLAFTEQCTTLGWKSAGTAFDILPLVLSMNDDEPTYFDIPKEIIMEVPITHPEIAEFQSLNLKWYAVPLVSDMLLEIGGIQYSAAPFNGWYMGTEIGARNLADDNRYNQLPAVAQLMGLDTTKASTLWKDKALVELNIAVLHSFKSQGVTIVDHHTAAQQFMRFEKNEAMSNREVTGRWSWLVPPLSPATTSIFHNSYSDHIISPKFYYRSK
ncbi:nitric oxide synthase oxygenase [Paenibacillus sp. GSMTC-2017]|uniref:nitric oxide synthase oxygenase n=1 Tax=Paenibacillus sp. GSMTC-2017 TaxID=2794350 RepID=UPI0018D8BFC5|nr:nitric oxide synthase oxygenase [Paenibacillus sp. GSMTC-2017]MBH5317871.1 nitric oxide synthase oxygenase [Paenibacillus sp. GSMTC-2017]